ncbi:MAG: hypothetical protein Ct9H300mP11_32070 [Chloroflexota bacterium]|nr:MAG: hypothetical protein Ct9H300mP11_32070 [Chloroflexota bacterium]
MIPIKSIPVIIQNAHFSPATKASATSGFTASNWFDAWDTHGGDDYGSGDGDTSDVSRVSYQLGQGRDYAVLRTIHALKIELLLGGNLITSPSTLGH